MSSNDCPEKLDPRTRRTRDRLGDALVALILQKPFDDITVQEVLDTAGVSRSTFYTHFKDKEDLFTSDADEFYLSMATLLTRTAEPGDRLAPVREFLAHVGSMRVLVEALQNSGRFDEHMDLARRHFARGIETRLLALERSRGLTDADRAVFSQALAGGFIALLTWWLGQGAREDPAQLDDAFHRMAWGGISNTLRPRC